MPEAVDLLKLAIAAIVIGFLGMVVAGFYFTVTNASGQGFLIGQFELLAEAIFNAVEAPFIALYKFIIGIPSKLGFLIMARLPRGLAMAIWRVNLVVA